MALVETVLGGRDGAAWAHAQVHEHLFVRPTPMSAVNPALCIDDFARSLAELRSYAARGGSFLADAQPVAAGRDAQALRDLSRESGVVICAATGYHLLGFYPGDSWVHALDENGLFQLYCGELAEGMLPWQADATRRPMSHTGIRAGLVKAAIPAEGPVGRYEILLRAAARAAADRQVPLMLHTEAGTHAADAVRLALAQGVCPERMVVCHVDRQARDMGPHEAVADLGVYLDYDTVGRFRYHSDEEEIVLLRHMVERGHAGQVLLALDTTAARLSTYGGEIGLTYLLDMFLPRLRAEGFDEDTLALFAVKNCARLFSF